VRSQRDRGHPRIMPEPIFEARLCSPGNVGIVERAGIHALWLTVMELQKKTRTNRPGL